MTRTKRIPIHQLLKSLWYMVSVGHPARDGAQIQPPSFHLLFSLNSILYELALSLIHLDIIYSISCDCLLEIIYCYLLHSTAPLLYRREVDLPINAPPVPASKAPRCLLSSSPCRHRIL